MKKNILTIIALTSFYYAQSNDVLISTSGIRNKGQFIKLEKNIIYFKDLGTKKPRKINTSIVDSVLIGDLYYVDLKTGNKILSKTAIERNSKVKYIVLPLKDDKYARTDTYVNYLNSFGYNVLPNYLALEYFSKNKISINNVNDYEIIKMAQELNIDNIIYGYLYLIKEDFKYSPDMKTITNYQSTSGVNPYNFVNPSSLTEILAAGTNNRAMDAEMKKKSTAISQAGTYLFETVYRIDIKSKEKVYLQKNGVVRKF